MGHLLTHRNAILIGGAIGASLLAPGLSSRIALAATPGTVTYALSAYPPNLRPFEYSGVASRTAKLLKFRSLLSFNDSGIIQSELADRCEVVDPRKYIFKLRRNPTSQYGAPVTAYDVKTSFDFIRAEKPTAYLRPAFQTIESIEVVDPKTVSVVLKQQTPAFLSVLAGQKAPIVVAKQMENPDAMIGTGPFTLEISEKGVSLTFRARAGLYSAHPYVSRSSAPATKMVWDARGINTQSGDN